MRLAGIGSFLYVFKRGTLRTVFKQDLNGAIMKLLRVPRGGVIFQQFKHLFQHRQRSVGAPAESKRVHLMRTSGPMYLNIHADLRGTMYGSRIENENFQR